MFLRGFVKTAMVGMKLPGPMNGMKSMSKPTRVDPVTVRDALGASKASGFAHPLSSFGHKPRGGLKALSRVRSAAH